MLDPQALINHVSSYLRRELTAELVKQSQTLSITLPVKDLRLRSLPDIDGDWFFWNRPADDEIILGLGHAMRITAYGQDRLEILDRGLREIHHNWERIDPELTGFRPLSYFCFAFDPADPMIGPWNSLPNSGLFLPELTLQQRDNRCAASFSVDLRKNQDMERIHQRWMVLFSTLLASLNQPHTTPGCKTALSRISSSADQSKWHHIVTKAQGAISAGTLKKVVPARHMRVLAEHKLDPSRLMTTLGFLYPNSMLLAARIEEQIFVSATPERLASHHNGEISCDAMAGTIHRSATEQRDHYLGELLLSDPKSRHEHQLVVEDINASLEPICSNIKYQKQPSLLRLRNLQHLHTEISGKLKPGINLLQAASRLHPTAAVNGYPGPEASQWLKQNESFDRGWYAGAAGWIDCHGDGELAVLLRCALLDQDQADLFAGAGITDGSDADAEYAETELKFGVMLEALENA